MKFDIMYSLAQNHKYYKINQYKIFNKVFHYFEVQNQRSLVFIYTYSISPFRLTPLQILK